MAKKSQFQKGVEFLKKQRKKLKGSGKKRSPGLLGRAGALLIGAGPLIVPVPGIVATAMSRDKKNVSIGSNMQASLFGYINGLSAGIGLGDVFPEMEFTNKDGSFRSKGNPGNGGVPRGSTLLIWATGFGYLIADKVAQVLNSGKGQNVPGTRTRLIGSG